MKNIPEIPQVDYHKLQFYKNIKPHEEGSLNLDLYFNELEDALFEEHKLLFFKKSKLLKIKLVLKSFIRKAFFKSPSIPHENIKKISDQGFETFKLRNNEKLLLRKILKKPMLDLYNIRKNKLPAQRGVEGSSIKLFQRKSLNSVQGLERLVRKILKRNYIFTILENVYNIEYYLASITLQINDFTDYSVTRHCKHKDSLSPLHYMHIDATFGTIKLLLYINEVSHQDGPFRFVPRSHKATSLIEKAIMKTNDKMGLDSLKPQSKEKFIQLPKFFQKKANFGNDVFEKSPMANQLLEQEVKFTSDLGDLILFDVNGFHRGNIEYQEGGKREILQIRLNPKLSSWSF